VKTTGWKEKPGDTKIPVRKDSGTNRPRLLECQQDAAKPEDCGNERGVIPRGYLTNRRQGFEKSNPSQHIGRAPLNTETKFLIFSIWESSSYIYNPTTWSR